MDEEKTFICPYNKIHRPKVSRMQQHLKRCREQFGAGQKMTTCMFNSSHIIPESESALHFEYCDSRTSHDRYFVQMPSNHELQESVKPFSAPKNALAFQDEIWDVQDCTRNESIIEKCKQNALTKPTLTYIIGAPKSERKAFRQQERIRYQTLSAMPREEPANQQFSHTGAISKNRTDALASSRVPSTIEVENVSLPLQHLNLIGDNLNENPDEFGLEQNNWEERKDKWEIKESAKDCSSLSGNKRDPNNPWKRNTCPNESASEEYKNTSSLEQQPTYKTEPSVSTKTKDGRDPGNPWKIKNTPPTLKNVNEDNDLPARDVLSRTTDGSSVLGFQERRGDGRDPTNPWKMRSPANDTPNSPQAQIENFPFLPVAGRGRGRGKKYRK